MTDTYSAYCFDSQVKSGNDELERGTGEVVFEESELWGQLGLRLVHLAPALSVIEYKVTHRK